MKLKSFIFILIIIFTSGINSQSLSLSDSINNPTTLTPFSNIGSNIAESFTGWDNILLQAAGIFSTVAISTSNIDNRVSTYFRDNQSYTSFAVPAVTLGSTLPLTAGAFLYIYGKLNKDNRMIGASFAVLQAHGWPSGHVGGTMSVASTLANYYSEKSWMRILSYSWVGYTMASVTIFHKGTMHWLSDAIAAGFMTYSIGKSVGNFYRNELPDNSKEVKFRLLPIVDSDYSGIYLSYSF